MPVTVKPTMIKQSVYLLVPKDIAELVDISKKTKFALHIKKAGKKTSLEYSTS